MFFQEHVGDTEALIVIRGMKNPACHAQCTDHAHIFKHLYDGRVDEVVSGTVVEERFDHWLKQEVPHDVAVVEFIF